MAAINADPPPFFNRGVSPGAKLTVCAMLALALMVADARLGYLTNIRYVVNTALYPLQRLAAMPGDAARQIGDYFNAQHALTEENHKLRRDLVHAGMLQPRAEALQRENNELRALLKASQRYDGTATAIEFLYGGRDPFSQKFYVDKGEQEGLRPGQVVIDGAGVVGQVTRIYPFTAEITLLTDKDHSVPVKVQRTGVRAVMYGSGAGRLPQLRHLAANVDIQPGDLLVTSGIDGTYPPDLAVARVANVDRGADAMFARITCQPVGGVDRSQYFLALSPPAPKAAKPELPPEAEKPAKASKKARRAAAAAPTP